ncbi:hypothetical protein Rxycam_01882 [Rubrobacter xylanophilus DSM 9941]|nr:hypothetical protein Rxycam_01882 [Rubrobacter xylanophilus DSM 9941]
MIRFREVGEVLNEEQRAFWEELLAYYRQELQERQSPEMVSLLGVFHGEEHARRDRELAEKGYVYLLRRGRLYVKRIDELEPPDAPELMAELEASEALAEEHSSVEGEVTVTEFPGGPTFTHPHYEDATRHLRERWRRLRGDWPRREV